MAADSLPLRQACRSLRRGAPRRCAPSRLTELVHWCGRLDADNALQQGG